MLDKFWASPSSVTHDCAVILNLEPKIRWKVTRKMLFALPIFLLHSHFYFIKQNLYITHPFFNLHNGHCFQSLKLDPVCIFFSIYDMNHFLLFPDYFSFLIDHEMIFQVTSTFLLQVR